MSAHRHAVTAVLWRTLTGSAKQGAGSVPEEAGLAEGVDDRAELVDEFVRADRLADPEVAAGGVVELLPLPTGPEELDRLIPLFEVTVYDRYYRGSSPFVDEELASEQAREALAHPAWLRERLDAIAAAITPEVHGPLRIGAPGPRTLG